MLHTQGQNIRNDRPLGGQLLARLRNGLVAGLAMMFLASCGGDGNGGNASSSSGNGTGDGSGIVRIGNGIGANFVEGTVGIVEPSLQSGDSTQLQINIVDAVGNAIVDPIVVTISSSCIASSHSMIEGALETITGGVSVNYISNGCVGEDLITVTTTTVDGISIQATGTVTIEEDEVLSVQFVPPQEAVQLSLKGVGGKETATVQFRLVGQQSAPIIGETITFSLSTEQGGIALAETSAESDNNGEVTAIVQSGTVHTTVVVTATHDATGVSGNSAGIDISTGIPQANRLSLSLNIMNPRAFDYDGTEVIFSIIAADQFGNPVPDNTVISFASPEGGTIPSSCSTVAGRCSVQWVSSNPRPNDGRATIIAYTSGAEAFTDNNANSIFDDGDSFDASDDLAEPYVDENENGSYDIGEFFVDFNSSGSRDVADGVWNGPLCEHSALCAPDADEVAISRTATLIMATNDVDVFISNAVANPFPPVGGTINLISGSTQLLQGLFLSDGLGNAAASGTSLSFETTIGALDSTTNFNVDDQTEALGPLSLLISAPTAIGQGVLSLKVDVPEVELQEFAWNVVITCPVPDNLSAEGETETSAILSWSDTGTSSWLLEYGPENFVEGTGTQIATSNPYLLDGLAEDTAYHFYVSSLCGGEAGDSAGPFRFVTLP